MIKCTRAELAHADNGWIRRRSLRRRVGPLRCRSRMRSCVRERRRDGDRRGQVHDRDLDRLECRRFRRDELLRCLVTRAHLRLVALVGLVVGTLAVIRIRTAALGLRRHRAQLRDGHADREHDRHHEGSGGSHDAAQAHPHIWALGRRSVNESPSSHGITVVRSALRAR